MTKLKCHVCGEEWGTCKHTKYFDGTMEDAEKIMRRLATKCYEFTKQIQSQAKLIEMLGEALKEVQYQYFDNDYGSNSYSCSLCSAEENEAHEPDCEIGKALSAYESWKQGKGE